MAVPREQHQELHRELSFFKGQEAAREKLQAVEDELRRASHVVHGKLLHSFESYTVGRSLENLSKLGVRSSLAELHDGGSSTSPWYDRVSGPVPKWLKEQTLQQVKEAAQDTETWFVLKPDDCTLAQWAALKREILNL